MLHYIYYAHAFFDWFCLPMILTQIHENDVVYVHMVNMAKLNAPKKC